MSIKSIEYRTGHNGMCSVKTSSLPLSGNRLNEQEVISLDNILHHHLDILAEQVTECGKPQRNTGTKTMASRDRGTVHSIGGPVSKRALRLVMGGDTMPTTDVQIPVYT